MRRIYAFVVFALTLITLAVINIPFIAKNANLGVEFKGGYEIVYEVASKDESRELTTQEKNELTEAASDVIVTRLDIAGVKNPIVEVEDGFNAEKQIRVTIGAVTYSEFKTIKDLIVSDVELSFRDVNDVDLVKQIISEDVSLGDGSDLLGKGGAYVAYANGQPGIVLNIQNTKLFEKITTYLSTRQESSLNKLVVWMNFDEETDSYANEINNAASDSKIIVAIDITSPISISSPFIQGDFSAEYANTVSNKLKAGSIDYKLVPSGYETKINASYGKDAIKNIIVAAVVALALITVALIVVYGIPGIASVITLFAYAAACFASLIILRAEIGPDALSAIAIGAGLALNSSIIIFERIKDELLKGRNLKKAFEEGSKKSLSSVLDSNLVALVVSLVLFFVGTRTVKTFATMLFLCVAFSLFMMVVLLKVFLSFIFKSQLLVKRKNLFGVKLEYIPNVKENEQQKYFGKFGTTNFTKNIKKFAIAPVALVAVGLVTLIVYSLVSTPLNLGSHFAEGSRITITSEVAEYDSVEEIKALFAENTIGLDVDVIEASTRDEETNKTYKVYNINFTSQLSNEKLSAIDTRLKEIADEATFDDFKFVYEISTVSAKVAVKTLQNASISFGIAALFVLAYMFIRYRLSTSLTSVITLVMNIVATVAVFVIFRFEINTEFITAMLAVMVFGVYDLAIVFDRLRENVNEAQVALTRESRLALINKTLQQTFTRSLVSLICVGLFPVALLVLGGQASIFLALTLLVGVVIGSFNSVFFAPMIWLFFENLFAKRARKKKEFKPKKDSDEPEEVTFIGVNDYR
jgi:SecD/SecF fusion protein